MNVSTYEDGKLVSPYLGIDSILDGVKKVNELNNKAYGVLVCLAVCDVLFNENTKKNLNNEFDSMILECNSDEDFKHADEMLKNASLEGGYAVTFYEEVKSKINNNYKLTLTNKDSSISRGPVSYINEDSKLCSPYFDVTFRPTGYKNFKLDIACSSLLMTLSVCDLKRDQNSQIKLLGDFCDILLAANTEEEHIMIKVFLDELVKNGGYAVEFNEEIRLLVGLENRATVLNVKNTVKEQLSKLDNSEVPQVTEEVTKEEVEIPKASSSIPQIQISTDINGEEATEKLIVDVVDTPSVGGAVDPLVQDFNDSYQKFNERLNTFNTSGDGDLEVLLRNGRRLQDQLLDCMKKMDKVEFDRLDNELEAKIKEIRMKMSS